MTSLPATEVSETAPLLQNVGYENHSANEPENQIELETNLSIQNYGSHDGSAYSHDCNDSDSQYKSDASEPPKSTVARRFLQLFILGTALIVAVQLSFLPRTSPSRDFRRWHNLRLTRTDVKRMFLVQLEIGKPDMDGLSIEKNVAEWLKMLSHINSKHPSALAASCALDATDFLVKNIETMNYEPRLATYPLSSNLQIPESLFLCLKDVDSGRVLYTANLREPVAQTPAFFVFSVNGTLSGLYVYAHHGTPADFAKLRDSDVKIKGRIVIFSHSPLDSDYSLAAKVLCAEEHGCAAVLVYDETEAHSISRAYRLQRPHLHMPVSSKQIQPILDTLAPEKPFSHWKYGPTAKDSSLELQITATLADTPLNATNVFATIEGVLNDAEIVIGASRDTLTSGNPSSGQAILLELMRRFQYLKLYGWRPLRSIRFAFWDSSRSGALGSSASVSDILEFKPNLPVLAYINLDQDVVMGSHLTVDANPLLNHVIKKTAKSVPFPRGSKYFQRLQKREGRENLDLESVANEQLQKWEDETSLWNYWTLQDKATINNKLGNTKGTDYGVFQLSKDTPVISIAYSSSPAYNDSTYIPESNYYNFDWLTQIDPDMELHGLLVRFAGLLTLSLGEHEVVEYKTRKYTEKVQAFLSDFEFSNKKILSKWSRRDVSVNTVGKSLLQAIRANSSLAEHVKFGAILNQTSSLLTELLESAEVYDDYSREVENLWTTDYPWYRMIRKIHIFAMFKFSNYKLLRIEKELNQQDDIVDQSLSSHFMYEVPNGVLSLSEEQRRGAFASLYEAAENGDFELLVKLISNKYERLASVSRKIK